MQNELWRSLLDLLKKDLHFYIKNILKKRRRKNSEHVLKIELYLGGPHPFKARNTE